MRFRTLVLAVSLLALAASWGGAQAPASAEIQRLLDEKKLTVDLVATPLPRVMEEFGRQTGIRCIIDLRQIPTPQDLVLTLKLQDVTARRFLDLACDDHRLGTRVAEGNVLVVTTADSLAQQVEVRIFDVRADSDVGAWYDRDLAFRRPHATGFEAPFSLAETGVAGVTSEELQNMIKDNIAKGTWDSEGRSLVYNDGLLIVRHRPEVVAAVARVLGTSHERRPRPMMLEWGIVDLPAEAVPPAEGRSALATRIVARGDGQAPWQAALAAPAARWAVHRWFPIHSAYAPEQGAALRQDRAVGNDGGWSFLTPEALTYRRGAEERVFLKLTLDTSDVPDPTRRRETRRMACALDLADGELAFVPLDEAGGVRALVLRLSQVAPGGWTERTEQPPAEDPAETALRAKLEERITCDLAAAPLERHLDLLRRKIGCNIHLTGAARATGFPDQRLELKLQDLPARAALSLIADQYGLGWKLTPGVILFDLPVDPVGGVEMLDVRDLLQASPTSRPPRLARNGPDAANAGGGTHLLLEDRRTGGAASIWDVSEERGFIYTEAVQDLIKQNVAPESWERRAEEVSIALDAQGQLWVVHTAEVLREIRAFLDRLRALRPPEVALEYRLIALPKAEVPPAGPPEGQAERWGSAAPGRESLQGGGLVTRAQGGAFTASVVRPGPGDAERGLVLAVSLGAPSPEGVLSAWLRVDWADARRPAAGIADGVRYEMAGYDGMIELPRGRTVPLVLAELAGERSLVLLLRWTPSR